MDEYIKWRGDIGGLMTIYMDEKKEKEIDIALTQGGNIITVSKDASKEEWTIIFFALIELISTVSSRNMEDCSNIDFKRKVEKSEVIELLRKFGIIVLNRKEDLKGEDVAAA